jgi:hypothetical protein
MGWFGLRKKDKDADNGKAVQAINFDKEVLDALEFKAKREGTKVSRIVNIYMRQLVLDDEVYYESLCRFYATKLAEAQYCRDRAKDKKLLN